MVNKELSIVIVNYNTRQFLQKCLFSIFENTKNTKYEIVVIDNNSSDGSAEMLRAGIPGVEPIINSKNLGFAKACNQGIKISKGENVLFLNPDTVILDNAIYKMVNFIDKHEDAGIVGPKLYINKQNKYHPSIRKFTKPFYVFLSFLPLSGLIKSIYSSYFLRRNRIRRADWLWGAALLVKKEVLDKIGYFDENFFMYSEDEDLCLRANKYGYKTYYFPQAEVIHFKGQSSKNEVSGSLIHMWESRMYYFRKYFSKRDIRFFKACFSWLLKFKAFLRLIPRYEADKILEILNKNGNS